ATATTQPTRRHGVMPDQTREVLRRIGQALRLAAGGEPATTPPPPADRRAEAGNVTAPSRAAAAPAASATKQP
ncbi:MAG TPA: hypothetical protein PK264_22530, partial [Hyphomicrobiaceae bacterium]|nr:hypothetical protein [Hyphomicrobiaceae bacterium]